MKKILILLLSLVFCICSAFAFACGGNVNVDGNININGGNNNDDNGGNDNTDDGNDDNGGNNDNGNTDGDDTGADDAQVEYEVTKAEFTQAIDISGVNFQATLTNEYKQVGGASNTETVNLTYTPTKIKITTPVEGQQMTVYYEIDGENYFQYVPVGNTYVKAPTIKEAVESFLMQYIPTFALSSPDAPSFEDFTYNESEKAYVYAMNENGMTGSFKLFFENGKVVKMSTTVVQAGEGSMSITVAYTYNNVTVTLPSVSGNMPDIGGDDNEGSEDVKPNPENPEQKPDVDDGKVEGGDTSCEHTWETVSLNDGVMTSVCHGCKATKTQDKTELYQYVTKSIFLSIEELASRESSNKPFSVKGNKDEYVWMDASWENQGMQVKGVVSFVHMLAQMMVNPQFNITNAPVKFTYSYAGLNESGTAILMYNFDEENDKVTMYWDVASNMNGNEMNIFLFLDVDYDFANYALKGFEIQTAQSMGDESICIGFRYNDQEFKMTIDPNFASQVNATATELQAHYDEIIDLEADFTKEYTEMMDYMNGSMGDNDPDEPSDNPGFNPDDMGFEIGTEDWFNTVLCVDKWDVRLTVSETVVDGQTVQNVFSEFVMSRGNIIGKQIVENREMYLCYLQTSNGIRLFNSADGKTWVEFNPEQNGGMSPDAMYGQTLYMCIPSNMIMGLVDFNSIFFNEDFTQAKMPKDFLSNFAFNDFMLTFENGRLANWTYSQQQGSFSITYNITYDYENVEMDVELPKVEGDMGDQPIVPENASKVYRIKSIRIEGVDYYVGDNVPYFGVLSADDIVITLKQDGTAIYKATFPTTNELIGFWTQEKDVIIININNDPASFMVKDDLLILEDDGEYQVYEFSGYATDGGSGSVTDKPINPNPENPEQGENPNPGYQSVYMVDRVIYDGNVYFVGDVFVDDQEITENFYLTVNGEHCEGGWNYVGDNAIQFVYVDLQGEKSYIDAIEDKELKIIVVALEPNFSVIFKHYYTAGNDYDDGGEDLPPEGGDVEIIEKQDYKFKFASLTYGGRKYYPGSNIFGTQITEDFATFILKADYSAEMIANGGVSTGSWRVWAGDLFATLTDNRATYDFKITYDYETNNITFSAGGFGYEFAMPEGVYFDQILGELPGCQVFTLNKIVAEGNEWTVGSEFNDEILAPESAMLIVYQDCTFKFINPQMSTIYGFWTKNQDGGILLTYDDTETIPLFMEGNGAIIYFSLDGFVTYYFNGSYQGGENEDLPPVESTPELNVNMPKVLRVGISPDYYPFGYYEEGKLVGFDVDFTKELAIALGYSLDSVEFVVVGEFETIFTKLCDGEFDVIISAVMKTEQREEVAFSSDSYVSFQVTYENEVGETVTENEDYVIYGTSFFVIDCINGAIQTLNEKGIIDELAAKWLK